MEQETEYKRACEDAIILIEEARDDSKTVGTRSSWLLGILVVIALALASFIIRSYALPPEIQTNSTFLLLRDTAKNLCYIYFGLVFIYIRTLIMQIFGEPKKLPRELPELQKALKWNFARLKKLIKQFKSLVFLSVASVPTSSFLAWVL